MKSILNLVAAALLVGCVAAAAVAEENSVTVTGKGETKQKPDVAFVTVFVKADAVTMVDAAKDVDQKTTEVKNALKKYKEITSIEVSDVAVGEYQQQVVQADQKQEGVHPEITRQVRIATAPEPARIYALIDTATSAGAAMSMPTTVYYPTELRTIVVYGLLKSAKAESQARELALADAKRQAESIATMAGKKLGGVLRVGGDKLSSPRTAVEIMGRESDLPTPYSGASSSEISVGCTLSVTFELKK